MSKISVIIPVFNAEKYIRKCLDSILDQTCKDLEVICVDDGSTDRSLDILREYENADRRVKVLSQENAGAGAARNKGLEYASGEFLSFLDSDDFFEPDMYERVLEKAEQYQADFVVFGSDQYYTDQDTFKSVNWVIRHKEIPPYQPFSYRSLTGNVFKTFVGWAWDKLYRKSFIDRWNLRFQEQRTSNDLFFVFSALVLAEKIAVDPQIYAHQRRDSAASLSKTRENSWWCFHDALIELKNLLIKEDIYWELEQDYINYALHFTLWNYNSLAEPTKTTLYEKLKKEWLKEFGIIGKEADYFYNKKEYTQYAEIFMDHSENKEDIKVSVIIPVYNAMSYLEECITSLLDQTLKETEYIFVDDGSTDSSPQLLQEYAEKDNRIKILYQKNQYAGIARNNGLKEAQGKYVIFLDADDFFDPELLEKTYARGVDQNADVVLFSADRYDNRKGEYLESPWLLEEQYAEGRDVFSAEDIHERIFQISSPAPWTKLFRRQFILNEHLQFQGIRSSNDLYFVFSALSIAKRITFIPDVLVHYRIGVATSLQGGTVKEPECVVEAYDALYNELVRRDTAELFRVSYESALISSIVFHLNKTHSPQEREIVYRKLCDGFLDKIAICERSPERFRHPIYAVQILGAPYAVEASSEIKRLLYRRNIQSSYKYNMSSRGGEKPLVSVIISVFNSEDYLEECLDSVIAQDQVPIEIICVNDGSTDRSLEILNGYAQKDSRIRICSQENLGLSAARNAGLTLASGKYTCFIDSDDMYAPGTIEALTSRMERDNLDILFFGGENFSDDGEWETNLNYKRYGEYDGVFRGTELIKLQLEYEEYRPTACMHMQKRAFLEENDLWFENGILHEDVSFTYICLMRASRSGCVRENYYLRRIHNDSIMQRPQTFWNCYGYFVNFLKMNKEFNSAHFVDEKEQCASEEVAYRCCYLAKAILLDIGPVKGQAYRLLPEVEQRWFKMFVYEPGFNKWLSNTTKLRLEGSWDRIRELKEERKELRRENKRILASRDYQIGSTVLKIPRKIKKASKK